MSMRTRERFLDVAKTVNFRLYPASHLLLGVACRHIEAGTDIPAEIEEDIVTMLYHDSSHIRSLAAEALFYAGEGGKKLPESGSNLPRTERETENKGEPA